MENLLSRLASQDAVGALFIVFAFLAGITIWLTLQWRLHRRTEMEAALKQDMLNRGMSAAEIERVMRASLAGPGDSTRGPEDPRQTQAYVSQPRRVD